MKSYVHDWYWRFVCIKCGHVRDHIVYERDRMSVTVPELCGGCGETRSMMLRPTRQTYHSFFWFWKENYSTWEVKDITEDSDDNIHQQ